MFSIISLNALCEETVLWTCTSYCSKFSTSRTTISAERLPESLKEFNGMEPKCLSTPIFFVNSWHKGAWPWPTYLFVKEIPTEELQNLWLEHRITLRAAQNMWWDALGRCQKQTRACRKPMCFFVEMLTGQMANFTDISSREWGRKQMVLNMLNGFGFAMFFSTEDLWPNNKPVELVEGGSGITNPGGISGSADKPTPSRHKPHLGVGPLLFLDSHGFFLVGNYHLGLMCFFARFLKQIQENVWTCWSMPNLCVPKLQLTLCIWNHPDQQLINIFLVSNHLLEEAGTVSPLGTSKFNQPWFSKPMNCLFHRYRTYPLIGLLLSHWLAVLTGTHTV